MDNKLHSFYSYLSETLQLGGGVSKFIFGFSISLLLILIPVIVATFVPLIFKKPKKEFSIYLYSFITGMFIILGTFGYLRESIEITSSGAGLKGENIPTANIYIYNILCVGGGALIGITLAFGVKILVYKIIKKKYNLKNSVFIHVHGMGEEHTHGDEVHEHHHEDHIFNANDLANIEHNESNAVAKNKWTALILLLSHRIPEGLLIGISLANLINNPNVSAISVAFFISFVLHTIPEEIVFYYRQREMGISSTFAALNSMGALSLIIPFIFIGLYGGDFIESIPALKAVIMAIVGVVMVFTAIMEFLPEFYHHRMGKKRWILTFAMFFLGVLFTIIVLSFHKHGT
ncbi:metal transporter [Mycoplasmopsis mucosicanis]|uniref:Metal transporter n=1 Tax=Mycoplasmopsis mucosicanis TaxID=458208 RepID=A0A507SY50_9BACT|nr:ZIP family metal transporter [Mycoplasmopsis mucosicanis]TQC54163.1 metal transporter [Mycoplasmopsis mucosicanis]